MRYATRSFIRSYNRVMDFFSWTVAYVFFIGFIFFVVSTCLSFCPINNGKVSIFITCPLTSLAFGAMKPRFQLIMKRLFRALP